MRPVPQARVDQAKEPSAPPQVPATPTAADTRRASYESVGLVVVGALLIILLFLVVWHLALAPPA